MWKILRREARALFCCCVRKERPHITQDLSYVTDQEHDFVKRELDSLKGGKNNDDKKDIRMEFMVRQVPQRRGFRRVLAALFPCCFKRNVYGIQQDSYPLGFLHLYRNDVDNEDDNSNCTPAMYDCESQKDDFEAFHIDKGPIHCIKKDTVVTSPMMNYPGPSEGKCLVKQYLSKSPDHSENCSKEFLIDPYVSLGEQPFEAVNQDDHSVNVNTVQAIDDVIDDEPVADEMYNTYVHRPLTYQPMEINFTNDYHDGRPCPNHDLPLDEIAHHPYYPSINSGYPSSNAPITDESSTIISLNQRKRTKTSEASDGGIFYTALEEQDVERPSKQFISTGTQTMQQTLNQINSSVTEPDDNDLKMLWEYGRRHSLQQVILPVIENDVSSLDADYEHSTEPFMDVMPPTGNGMYLTGNEMPPTSNEIPPTGNEMHPTGNEMPPTGNEVPPTSNEIPPTGNEMHSTGNEMPSTSKVPSQYLPPKDLIPSPASIPPLTPEDKATIRRQKNKEAARRCRANRKKRNDNKVVTAQFEDEIRATTEKLKKEQVQLEYEIRSVENQMNDCVGQYIRQAFDFNNLEVMRQQIINLASMHCEHALNGSPKKDIDFEASLLRDEIFSRVEKIFPGFVTDVLKDLVIKCSTK